MPLSRLSIREWMLPLLILAFVGLSVTFLTPVFNTTSRWLVLLGVATWLLPRGDLFRPLRHHLGIFTVLFGVWCLLTATWSELPDLSLMKAVAFLLIAVTAMAAGLHWVKQHPTGDALSYLLPLTILALAAGVLGRFETSSVVVLSEGVTTYQGAVGGANMFGSMLAMCSPFLIWRVRSDWQDRRKRVVWLALLSAVIFYLLAAKSRSAFLVVICASAGLLLGSSLRRKVAISMAAVTAIAGLWVLAPWALEQIERDYAYKHGLDQSLLFSRQEVWDESYEQAAKGGWVGGGYGVTIGDLSFEGGLTAIAYGREKANSQLAIVEETGLVGLVLYVVVLGSLFRTLVRGLRQRRQPEVRLQLCLVGGMLAGMLCASVFEAWWVAPSSPESVYFWVLTGVALGLATDRRTQSAPGNVGAPQGGHPLRTQAIRISR